MFVIRECNRGEYAYHGEGWAFTSDFNMAKKFTALDDARAAVREIMKKSPELLLAVVELEKVYGIGVDPS